ncbi:primosomal protein N' [Spirulina sp. 06S082]|uniref:primosomal protein N' n=1 Tax=Spirulina sp. 06S082 TaxID=3110248 RepID=UPI002B20FD00|nr:primosomal protein N' [Spirulina sp. 06S082]MEA5471143.1 primosomal protein N' [Spirulina sp. 06S082]
MSNAISMISTISAISSTSPIVSEPQVVYGDRREGDRWIEVLVNCEEIDYLLTYSVPLGLEVHPGDIVLVPLKTQILKGIAIRPTQILPANLAPNDIRNIIDIIAKGIFSSTYLQLLEKVATYYFAPRIVVFRSALPPGTLRESQRRIRLNSKLLPEGAEVFCSPVARKIIALLQVSKDGDYSAKYIKGKIKGASKGLKDLIKRGWVKSYLAPPKTSRPKLQKVVILVSTNVFLKPSSREEKALSLLQRLGGEEILAKLHKFHGVDYDVIKSLENKGCILVEEQEILRFSSEPKVEKDNPKALNIHQAKALETIKNLQGFACVLLHGITGSGKTEVYLQTISHILEQGKSAIVLVPEIGLTPQLTDRFRARFGEQVCVYHSALNEGERYDTWRFLLSNEPHIVIGTRSAVFTPVPNLGLIILDEEHDHSFKQQERTPTYHARTVAQWRAELENCPLILGSATPSLETWVTSRNREEDNHLSPPSTPPSPLSTINSPLSTINYQLSTTHYLSLPHRIYSRPLPPVEVVDMRRELKQGNRSIFSFALQDALKQLKPTGKQGILFIPRRGHSTFVSCRNCGYVIECPHCDVSLSYHHVRAEATQILRCHYCNHSSLHPSLCPECESPYLKFFGSGTQKVVRAIEKEFPDLRVIRFDSDTTRGKGAHRTKLTQFAQGEADLLVGTQMLTKGLDVAQVTLVGIVAADGLLNLADYRASERAFQTLTQVAGRAGRGDDPGRVILQTYTPEHPVVEAVCNHDYLSFSQQTLPERSQLNYPPYGRLILLRFSGLNAEEVEATADLVAQGCRNLFASVNHELLGPAPASIMRIDRRYRWQILLKFARDIDNLPDLLQLKGLCPQSVRLTIDVDPLSIN